MTLFDLAMIALAGAAVLILAKGGWRRSVAELGAGLWVIAFGLATVGTFYLFDLFVMHGLPLLVPRPAAMALMEELHRHYSWMVNLVGATSIFAGLVLTSRQVRSTVHKLRRVEEDLSQLLKQDITERQRAEDGLRLTEFAIDHASDPIYWVKEDSRITYANQAACRTLGYSHDEFVSMSVPAIDPDFPPEAWAAHWQEMKRAGSLTFQAHHQAKDGRVFPVEITTSYLEHRSQEFVWAYVRDITERVRAEEALRLLVEGTASPTGDKFFPRLVRTLADALQVKFAFVSELADAEGQRLRLISFWAGTDYGENFEYSTRDTPCQEVVGKGLACYPARVQELFPRDAWLREAGIESYLAIPLFDADGKPLGHLGVMHDAPMEESAFAESILKIFAARAGSELERRKL